MPQGSGQTFRPASAQAPPRAAPAPSTPQAPTSSTPGSGCLKCKSTTHKVRECPGITDDEAVRLLKAHGRVLGQKRGDWSRGDGRADAGRGRGIPGGRVATMRTNTVKVGREDLTATVDGVVPVRASLLDSGADLSVASGGLVSALLAAGAAPEIIMLGPTTLRPYGTDSRPITVTKQVRLGRLEFNTGCGPLMFRGLRVWIDEAEAAVELTLGLPVMQKVGYSEQTLLENARRQQAVWDFDDQPDTTPGIAMHRTLRMEELSDGIDDDEGMCCATPELGMIPSLADAETVHTVLMAKVAEAAADGMEEPAVETLQDLLLEFRDVFRLRFGRDPPVRVKPLKVHLKRVSVPVKSGLRRYPPTHMAFLEKHVRELEEAGLVYRNTRSRWAAAPRIVPKKDPGDLRMTIDSRPINACTEPMPNLDVAMGVLKDSLVYFSLDWIKGYWQLPLPPDSQEYYSFMTPVGVVTPTRVLMGQSDAVAYCQGVVDELFGDLLMHGVLGWLDELLGYAGTTTELLQLLRQVLGICHISAQSPSRVQGLCGLEPPQTAADLQQFLCATNWMRANIPQYTELVAPLTRLMDIAANAADPRKKTALTRVALSSVGWAEDHLTCFERRYSAWCLCPTRTLIRCRNAGSNQDLALPANDQRHEPLSFLSGAFRGSSKRWPVVEKEAFAVVESCKQLECLLIRPGGFRLFTDHRNIVYMFNPLRSNSNMAKYQAHKLQRWALTMTTFPYVVECVAGEDNLWADLLSRWGSLAGPDRGARMQKLALVSSLRAEEFIWIPDDALDMQVRICVVAHAGVAGHRRVEATTASVADMFDWPTLKANVKNFVRACLHCMESLCLGLGAKHCMRPSPTS
ncbi:hypothetical protein H257_09910 [Aphanomyces astaci]|uniref:Reverse transcriptase n=1 Tax=Aphanomyces astaci TaxID=112090 RepID=W4G9I8_APHAT|nr:hypothetical protein H257_09910 [Aphanomyces astaci]ETV75951.1 hypothetical protein H257_09910 [Aphanomyces astaci]|eukprot:XP_009834593.1 hypothetical protein H257_09910 [Aphanomyces astaci]